MDYNKVNQSKKKQEKQEDVVCFSKSDWDLEIKSNRYHMVSRFKKNRRCFFFEEPVNLLLFVLSALKNGYVKPENKVLLRKALKFVYKREENLYTITPVHVEIPSKKIKLFVFLNKTVFNPIYLKMVYYLIIRSIYKINNPIFWFYDYYAVCLLRFKYKIACYHCTEDYRAMFRAWSDLPELWLIYLGNMEDALVKRVDLVFCVSESLARRHKKNNANTHWIGNGVDYLHYEKACNKKNASKKRLGYIGNISVKVDLDLLLLASRNFPECDIVLVGPVTHNDIETFKRLCARENVTYIGQQDSSELPHIMYRFSVCLIPFVVDDWFVKCSQPLKLFEYMASGKPIVSTYMDCLKKLPRDCVYVSPHHQTFIDNIKSALSENDPELAKRRQALARKHDWDKLFEKIDQLTDSLLKKKIGRINER